MSYNFLPYNQDQQFLLPDCASQVIVAQGATLEANDVARPTGL